MKSSTEPVGENFIGVVSAGSLHPARLAIRSRRQAQVREETLDCGGISFI
jgi:hypothetical protein